MGRKIHLKVTNTVGMLSSQQRRRFLGRAPVRGRSKLELARVGVLRKLEIFLRELPKLEFLQLDLLSLAAHQEGGRNMEAHDRVGEKLESENQ